MIFDSHAHYNDSKFEDRDTLLSSLFADGVGAIVNASVSVVDSKRTLELCEAHPNMFAAVGIHPSDIDKVGRLDSAVSEIEALAAHPKAVAVGEIGLDYYWEPYDKDKQKAFFISQLELARKINMPVVIHDRESHGDVDEIIRAFPDVKILLHSYSGSAEWARELTKAGRYISFSGVVTFKNARKAVEAAEVVPIDKLLIETDCPYLAPTPLRGSVNHSGNLLYTAGRLAEIKGISLEDMLSITFENACKFYNIDKSMLTDISGKEIL
ncbi:MAG: TatD family hydrolase [Clostridia bacterium]|nr:TatD family hydrolase [Clostridia bacterium]